VEAAQPVVIRRGTPAFVRANIAFFLSAFAIFASLYSVQPLLPIFAAEFELDAGTSSLTLSATTGPLALALLLASWVADRVGRKLLMVCAIVATAILGLLLPIAPNWHSLIAIRTCSPTIWALRSGDAGRLYLGGLGMEWRHDR